MNPDKKICIYKFNELTFVNQRLISIRPNKNVDTELLHALINSIYCTSQIEAIGFGRGAGVLDINATRIKEAYTFQIWILYLQRIKRDFVVI